MRLLNSVNLELNQFVGDNIPEYPILSHTWVDDVKSWVPENTEHLLAGVGGTVELGLDRSVCHFLSHFP
jgi:hypothetical protein